MKKMRLHLATLLVIVLFFGLQSNGWAEISVDSSMSHNSFPIDGAAILTITVSGARKGAAIALPTIDNLQLHSRGQSSQINMVNNNITSMVSYNYLVRGTQPGGYTIPPITVTIGNETFTTKPLTFTILPTGQQKRSAHKEVAVKDIAYIKISPIGTHYPGEIVPITLKVYLDRQYRSDISTLPVLHGAGVVMEQLSTTPQQTQENIGGKNFHVITWETTLSGIKTGKHPISFSLDGTLMIPQKRRSSSPFSNFGRGSIFSDSIFDDFFDNYRREPITITSPDLLFTVIPIPTQNRPDQFTGAIGEFNMQASAGPTEIEVGEPVTLKVQISGNGNFDRVEAPVFEENNSWKTYSPSASFSEGSVKAEGTKTFEQAIVLKDGTVREIPSLAFHYFSPKQQQYITVTSLPIPLSVKSQVAPPVQPRSNEDHQLAGNVETELPPPAKGLYGLAPIHLELGSFSDKLEPLYQKLWFIVTCTICILVAVTSLFYQYRQAQQRKHPEINFKKQSRTLLQADLASVENAVSVNDPKRFLYHCRLTIQNQLGNRHSREPSSISLTDLETWLDSDSVLIQAFTLAEEAVYGGATLSEEEMKSIHTRVKTALEALV